MIKTNKKLLPTHMSRENGNAMVYVLIAIALFGFLTVALSRQNNQSDGQDLTDEIVSLFTNELINYTSSAQQVLDMMIMSGSDVSDLVFLTPGDAGFETGSHAHKVFHPAGGALKHEANYTADASNGGSNDWWFQDNLNVEWTDTTAADVIITANDIKQSICENINRKITGNTTIPALTGDTEDIFDPDNYTAGAFNSTNCAGCDGFVTLCVSNSAVDTFAYYSIIAAE